jgi:hypothetical protein
MPAYQCRLLSFILRPLWTPRPHDTCSGRLLVFVMTPGAEIAPEIDPTLLPKQANLIATQSLLRGNAERVENESMPSPHAPAWGLPSPVRRPAYVPTQEHGKCDAERRPDRIAL